MPRKIYFQILILLSIVVPITTGCYSNSNIQTNYAWSITDLRVLSSDFSIPSSYNIVAAYTREIGSDIQIRLDFLDLQIEDEFDIYLALDTAPGGSNELPLSIESQLEWETLIIITADKPPAAYFPKSVDHQNYYTSQRLDLIPRVVSDPIMDKVTISLNKAAFPLYNRLFKAQVFVTLPGSSTPLDTIGPFDFSNTPQSKAPLLIAFWNVFPAYTPAQALRRWDGAHTGPFGERHGLNLLLQAVRTYQIPIFLLDLNTPTSLSALDYLDKMDLVRGLVRDNLVNLPDALPTPAYFYDLSSTNTSVAPLTRSLPDWFLNCALAQNRQISNSFGLPTSNVLFAPQLPSHPPQGYLTILTFSSEAQPRRWLQSIVIPLPKILYGQNNHESTLSMDIRKSLLKQAAAGGINDLAKLIILGGDLPSSAWGDPAYSDEIIRYIVEHPWMMPLSSHDLMTMRNGADFTSTNTGLPFKDHQNPLDQPDNIAQLCESSLDISNSPIESTAMLTYLSLLAPLPPEPPSLVDLRMNYVSQVHHLIGTSKWVEQPYSLTNCSIDLDNDSQAECLLASETYFAIFEKLGARLLYFFIRLENENSTGYDIHQLIGPTSQFLVGIGDPGSWDVSSGDASDKNGVQGAFSDNIYNWDAYSPILITEDHILFESSDRKLYKSYTFDHNKLTVEYSSVGPFKTKIPLSLDPWIRFNKDWGEQYFEESFEGVWLWGIRNGAHLEVSTNGVLEAHPFTASKADLDVREDPNYGYPPGHFLPFPMAILEVQSQNDPLSVSIIFSMSDKN